MLSCHPIQLSSRWENMIRFKYWLKKSKKENARFRNSCTIFHGKGLTSNSKYGSWVSSHQMQIYGRAQDERFSKKDKLTIWMGGNCCSRKKKWYLLTSILIYLASVIARRNISRIVLNISICFFFSRPRPMAKVIFIHIS